MSTIALKVRCRSCDGLGFYSTYQPGAEPVPCWSCEGKGYTRGSMTAPDPKWARRYKKAGAEFGSKGNPS